MVTLYTPSGGYVLALFHPQALCAAGQQVKAELVLVFVYEKGTEHSSSFGTRGQDRETRATGKLRLGRSTGKSARKAQKKETGRNRQGRRKRGGSRTMPRVEGEKARNRTATPPPSDPGRSKRGQEASVGRRQKAGSNDGNTRMLTLKTTCRPPHDASISSSSPFLHDGVSPCCQSSTGVSAAARQAGVPGQRRLHFLVQCGLHAVAIAMHRGPCGRLPPRPPRPASREALQTGAFKCSQSDGCLESAAPWAGHPARFLDCTSTLSCLSRDIQRWIAAHHRGPQGLVGRAPDWVFPHFARAAERRVAPLPCGHRIISSARRSASHPPSRPSATPARQGPEVSRLALSECQSGRRVRRPPSGLECHNHVARTLQGLPYIQGLSPPVSGARKGAFWRAPDFSEAKAQGRAVPLLS
jgi:hypothetical protein